MNEHLNDFVNGHQPWLRSARTITLVGPLRRAPHLINRVTAFLKRGRASQSQVRETGWDYSCCLPGEAFSTVRTRNIFALWRFFTSTPNPSDRCPCKSLSVTLQPYRGTPSEYGDLQNHDPGSRTLLSSLHGWILRHTT